MLVATVVEPTPRSQELHKAEELPESRIRGSMCHLNFVLIGRGLTGIAGCDRCITHAPQPALNLRNIEGLEAFKHFVIGSWDENLRTAPSKSGCRAYI